MKKRIFFLALLTFGVLTASAQVDLTSIIINPSFEADEAANSLKSGFTNEYTGWTITTSSTSNSQAGIANASTEIQGIGSTFAPSSGEKFLYIRVNWQGNTKFAVSQTVENVTLPPGVYTLSSKMVKYVSSGNANYSLKIKAGEQEKETTTTQNTTKAWSDWSVQLTLEEEITSSLVITAAMTPTNSGSGRHYCMFLDDFKLTFEPFATAQDYENLNTALTSAEAVAKEKTLGFEEGEFAPYMNADALSGIAEAKSLDQNVVHTQVEIQALTEKLNNAVWTANTEEVNAVFDGSFEHDYSGQSGNVQPIGWYREKGKTSDGYNVRYVTSDGNAGVGYTSSGKGLFTKLNAFYGWETGYTMPLKANTFYKVSLSAGGWGDCQDHTAYITITNPTDVKENIEEFEVPNTTANSDPTSASWLDLTAVFKTGDAGDYVLGLCPRNSANKSQNQFVYGDIKLVRATEAEIAAYLSEQKENLQAEIDLASTISDVNVGSKPFQIPQSAYDALTSAIDEAQTSYDDPEVDTADEINAAISALKAAEDAFRDAELNAPAEGSLFNIINVSNDYYEGRALTFKSDKDADLTQNTTGMSWGAEAGSYWPQAVRFVKVEGEKNTYHLCYTRADGNITYVSTNKIAYNSGDNKQIRPTNDPEKALDIIVKIKDVDKQDVWGLFNTADNLFIGANDNDGGYGFYTNGSSKNSDVQIVPAANHEVTLNVKAENQYGTLILPFDAEIPEGLEAYACEKVTDNELELTEVTELLSNTPYIVYAENGLSATFSGIANAYKDAVLNEGLLYGVFTETDAPNGAYVLQNHDGNVAFYLVNAEAATPKVGKNRAYLQMAAGDDTSEAKVLGFKDRQPTDINLDALKAIANGKVAIFNLAGVRIPHLCKGVNIVVENGQVRKVIVK